MVILKINILDSFLFYQYKHMINQLRNKTLYSFIIACSIVLFTMINQKGLTSLLISLSFIYVFGQYLIMYHNQRIGSIYVHLIFTSICFVFLNVSISGLGGFDYYKKAIMYIATLFWMACCIHTKISRKTAISIFILNIVINVIYIIFYRQGFSIFEGQKLLSLNFLNPNQAGMFILNSLLYIGIFLVAADDIWTDKKRIRRIQFFVLPLFIFIIYLMYLTGCRSSMLSLLAFLGLVIVDHILEHGLILKKWMLFLVAIFPFLFAIIYINYIDLFDFDVSMGIEDAGKSSTTRVSVWAPVIDNISYYLICGDYYGISNGTGFSQLHNTHVDVFASYGLIPFVLFVTILYKVLCKSMRHSICRFQRVSLFAFVACMTSCTFEASLVAGSGGLFLFTLGFLLLANYQKS